MKLTFYRGTHGILLFAPEKLRATKELVAIPYTDFTLRKHNKNYYIAFLTI